MTGYVTSPHGSCLLQADEELLKLSVGDLPGVGWQMQKKLEKLGLSAVADVRNSRREVLQRELGAKSGSMARPPIIIWPPIVIAA